MSPRKHTERVKEGKGEAIACRDLKVVFAGRGRQLFQQLADIWQEEAHLDQYTGVHSLHQNCLDDILLCAGTEPFSVGWGMLTMTRIQAAILKRGGQASTELFRTIGEHIMDSERALLIRVSPRTKAR